MNINKKRIILALAAMVTLLPLIFFSSLVNIQTNMLSLLPKDKDHIIKQKAFDHLADKTSQKIIILFGSNSKKTSYEAAQFFYKNIKENNSIEKIEFKMDSKNSNEVINFYAPYRHQILSPEFSSLLANNEEEEIQKRAIEDIYMPQNSRIVFNIAKDPFLLLSSFLNQLPFLKTSLFPYKDILVAKHNAKYYAFSSISIRNDALFSIKELANIVKNIKEVKIETQKSFDVKILSSGMATHSNSFNQNSIKEINIIGLISILVIMYLIYFNFRSTKPLFFTLFSIIVGVLAAFITTNLLFKEIHLLTIIFGTSLIGVSIDYSFHFFAEYFNKSTQKNAGRTILKRIFPGISIGLLTSLVCYLALFFTPFPILNQIACFSTIGLITSYLVVILFFPKFYRPGRLIYDSYLLNFSKVFLHNFQKRVSRKGAYVILMALLSLSLIGLNKLNISNDLKLLDAPKKEIIDEENLVKNIIKQDKSSYFILVTADTSQQVLEKELLATRYLTRLIKAKKLLSYKSFSDLVPPIMQQKQDLELVKSNLLYPYLTKQSRILGLSDQHVLDLKNEISKKPSYLTPKKILQKPSFDVLKTLWMGKVDNKYASIILLNGVVEGEFLKAFHSEQYGVYLLNKKEDIRSVLEEYQTTSFLLIIGVYLLILLLLSYRYGLLHAILVALPPLLSGITSLAIIALLGYEISLFNILALFLIIGIGIDYTIFYAEARNHENTTSLAISLSCITTLLSFGLLSFSSFEVIHSFGLTILFGILLCYILSPMATLKK